VAKINSETLKLMREIRSLEEERDSLLAEYHLRRAEVVKLEKIQSLLEKSSQISKK